MFTGLLQIFRFSGIFITMTVQDLEKEVSKLSPDELSQLRQWFEEYDAWKWDNQIQDDATNGTLDSLANESLRDFDSGKCSML